ncbi:Uncharacterised protein [Vibrio cholerae]|nr:Uncharacterised protein [Vibrio cholerae]CSB46765.1 Uncharacterised protein [Vibrio cholerae]CSI06137.1 Uncharacterised protein [Vibrio cholerae]
MADLTIMLHKITHIVMTIFITKTTVQHQGRLKPFMGVLRNRNPLADVHQIHPYIIFRLQR